MTERGKLECLKCSAFAIWVDCASSNIAASDNHWCDKHLPLEIGNNCCGRIKIKQELIELTSGEIIWYPSLFINGEWLGFPYQKIKPRKWYQFWRMK